ncbi:hypothetical protein BUALT_Bualt01G0199100 [Buddleja alternifolia]|uniref:Uncharacterized protein n=1 Tax=Buddleja alternifolia TaxID=168488 RepID=A0AAV6YA63_9LAMI|nr:hypothetical protein BUALT_Bualt01G0199100 [Buddleja alternifolia]
MPVKTSTDNFIKETQVELVVIDHVPKSNPEKQFFSEVRMQPFDNSKTRSKMTRSNNCLIMPITKIDSSPHTESSPVRVFCKKLQGTFNHKAYKLLEKSGYEFSTPLGLGKLEPQLTGEKIHGVTKAQHKLRKQGYHVDQPKTGLGFTPAEPIRILVTKKENLRRYEDTGEEVKYLMSSAKKMLGTSLVCSRMKDYQFDAGANTSGTVSRVLLEM